MATTTLHAPTTASSTEEFERIYAEARGDASRIPWADLRPHPALVNWLNAVAPSLVRSGARVCVVGCGLGDDARELIRRGYDVTAFDCSATAINWAKKRDPRNGASFVVADVFDLPARWEHRFDLVVEINTLQSLPPELHEQALQSITSLISRHGRLLVIARCAASPSHRLTDAPSHDEGPPFPLTEEELLHIAGTAGLAPASPISVFTDDETPPVQRMRAVFQRA